IQVVLDGEIERGDLADMLEDLIVVLAASRYAVDDDVGDRHANLFDLSVRLGSGLFKLLHLGRELLSFSKDRRTIFGARLPDRAGESFLLGARLFSHLQGGATRLIGGKEVI